MSKVYQLTIVLSMVVFTALPVTATAFSLTQTARTVYCTVNSWLGIADSCTPAQTEPTQAEKLQALIGKQLYKQPAAVALASDEVATGTLPATPTAPVEISAPTVVNNITNPIVERTVETRTVVQEPSFTLAEVTAAVNALRTELTNRINGQSLPASYGAPVAPQYPNTWGLTQRIDQLFGVTFTGGSIANTTITGTPISGSTGSFTSLSASGDATVSGTTTTGNLVVTGSLTTPFTAGSILFANSAGVLTQDTSIFWDEANHFLGLGTLSPEAPIHIGTLTAATPDPAIIVARNLIGGGNAHAFTDETIFNQTGSSASYNSYDARAEILTHGSDPGTHYAAFQARPTLSSGSILDEYRMFIAVPDITNGTVDEYFGFKSNPTASGGTINTGYGFYAARLPNTTNPYGIYVQSDKSYFGGSVGIGTTSPSSSFEVEGNNNFVTRGYVTNTHTGPAAFSEFTVRNDYNTGNAAGGLRLLSFGSGYTTSGRFIQDGTLLESGLGASGGLGISARASGASIMFYTGGDNERARIDALGNIGIGTSTPKAALHIYQGASGQANPNSSSKMILEDDGNTALSILTPSTSVGSILFADEASPQVGRISYEHTTNNLALYAGSTRVMDLYGGNVGIGTTTPSQKLTVYNGSTTGTYTTSGWVHSSDARLKTNVAVISDALRTIDQLEGVTFNWNTNPDGQQQIGFIAQDVKEVLPQVVVGSDEDGYGISYGNITALLTNGVKELWRKVQENSSKVAELFVWKGEKDVQIAALEARVAALEANQGHQIISGEQDTTTTNLTDAATLTLNGNATSTIDRNTTYSDLGATFTHSGTTETIYATTTVDTSEVGTTTLDYYGTYYTDPTATSSAVTLHAARVVIVIDPYAAQEQQATSTEPVATSTEPTTPAATSSQEMTGGTAQ